jgi:alpha,alpha-trehalose phosphorylase
MTAAAEVGHLDLALDYTAETAFIDLRDLAQNTRNGMHLAALAGTRIALVGGFGGLRDWPVADGAAGLRFAPRLPRGLAGLGFGVRYRGGRIAVEIGRDEVTYTWDADDIFTHSDTGGAVRLCHHGEEFTLAHKESVTLPVPPAPDLPPPAQPAGREPARRGAADA